MKTWQEPGAPDQALAQHWAGGGGRRGSPAGRGDAPIFSLEKKAKPQHIRHATQIFVFLLERARAAGPGLEAHAWLSHAGWEGAWPVPAHRTQRSLRRSLPGPRPPPFRGRARPRPPPTSLGLPTPCPRPAPPLSRRRWKSASQNPFSARPSLQRALCPRAGHRPRPRGQVSLLVGAVLTALHGCLSLPGRSRYEKGTPKVLPASRGAGLSWGRWSSDHGR